MGVAASPTGIRALVLPTATRQAVEKALAPRWRSSLEVRRSGTGGEAGRRRAHRPRSGTSNLERLLREAKRQIERYLGGQSHTVECPLDLSEGTPFQRRVWRVTRRIPYGQVRSYQWVASKVGGTRYARAVGAALKANPVPLLVPCHRVVARDAALGGFSGGLSVKRKLLELEGALALLKQGARPAAMGRRQVQRGAFSPAPGLSRTAGWGSV